ncbi:MAG: hypothetical protein IJ669_01320 [Prevotella sp.]|nr:hypothetical protein [Prevotella sp.]
MATIKNFTNIAQSKTLSEILPIETADAIYPWRELIKDYDSVYVPEDMSNIGEEDIPCWSLATLLDTLPPIEGFRPIIDLDVNLIRYEGNYRDKLCFNGNNLIDACYEMIIKLNELKIL